MSNNTQAPIPQKAAAKPSAKFKIEVVYCAPGGPERQVVELLDGATIEDALKRARFLERFRDMNMSVNRVGIFGNLATLQTKLRPGDRVEVYRPITCDPETVTRKDIEREDHEG